MTHQLSIDPGLNTGVALAYYDATTPYRLLGRYQVHNGLDGFLEWQDGMAHQVDEFIVEKFIYDPTADNADLSGVPIEGVVARWARDLGAPVIWQSRFDKSALTGYPKEATTKAQRQRVRFDWLTEHGLFKAGTDNDDSHDAICHGLISLKKRRHAPTLRAFWPPRREAA